jgi:crotonobetainyl-CoA:carnitine CoA-transferase CaiB-like acyl-CoA transferase
VSHAATASGGPHDAAANGPLSGIRVIDLTMWFQGPVAGQLLADFGAEVIHVERPQGGDLGRGVRSIKALPVGDWNQYFLVINRNKKSLALDLNKPEGRDVLYRLAREADVFLTNVTAENLRKWDVTYDRLSMINPRLIYAVGSGFGHVGEITRPSFDLTVQALTGLMSRLGEPGQPPIYAGMGSGDAMGGLMAALGIMLALHARRHTGRGQLVDASLYGAQLFLAAPSLQAYLATGSEAHSRQQSRRCRPNPLWNVFPASDKWIFVCAANDDEAWGRLCGAIGAGALRADPEFASSAQRKAAAAELTDALDAILSARGADEWLRRLSDAAIDAGPVNNLAEMAEDPQAWANDYLLRAHCDEVDREVVIRGLPIRLSKTPATVRTLGPELGQHTEELLVDALGYSWDEVGRLKEKGVIL